MSSNSEPGNQSILNSTATNPVIRGDQKVPTFPVEKVFTDAETESSKEMFKTIGETNV